MNIDLHKSLMAVKTTKIMKSRTLFLIFLLTDLVFGEVYVADHQLGNKEFPTKTTKQISKMISFRIRALVREGARGAVAPPSFWGLT